MKFQPRRRALFGWLWLLAIFAALWPISDRAQWPFGPPTTPDAQRNALRSVRSQVNWLQNSTRSAPDFGAAGYGNVWQMFQGLRSTYSALKQTLTPQQLAYGANQLAELDAGLDIIQEAFTNYQEDIAAGQPGSMALNNMCRVLRQGSGVWLQELNKNCQRLRVGW
jgi:hypothetical protein